MWNLSFLIPLLVTTVVAICGWFAVHALTSARDKANKCRELRVAFLIDAYRRLEFASRRQHDSETVRALESALADIQLMGSPSQVAMIHDYLAALANDPTVDPGTLLQSLRTELRQELKLPALPEGGVIARVNPAAYKHKMGTDHE